MSESPATRGSIFRNPKGKVWQISATGLELNESPARPRVFDDYDALFSEALRRIKTKRKAGYELIGNRAALEQGAHNAVSDAQIETVKAQFGPRRSIWTDTFEELAEVLSDPESYTGGVLLVDGDLVLNNHWDIRKFAAVVVLGDCTVGGVVFQYETEPWFIVTGDLRVRNLVMAGNMDIRGDLVVEECAEFESGLGYAHVGGLLRASTIIGWDMPVTCKRLECGTLVSNHSSATNPTGNIVCEEHALLESLGSPLCGPNLLHFSEHALDFNGLEGAEREAEMATGSCPELDLKQRELIHFLGLPLIR